MCIGPKTCDSSALAPCIGVIWRLLQQQFAVGHVKALQLCRRRQRSNVTGDLQAGPIREVT